MNRLTAILLLALVYLPVSAQKDAEAVKILTDFSRKAESAASVSIDFTVVTSDAKDGTTDTMDGSVVLKGDSYRLTLPENNIWANGKTIWSYLPDVNEVSITEPDPEDKSFMSKPSLLFSIYREGYKIRLLEDKREEWTIDLYPEDINTNLIRIRLIIGKTLFDLKSAEYKTKDGLTLTLKPKRYDLTFKPGADYFTFNPALYKGIEVIDMR